MLLHGERVLHGAVKGSGPEPDRALLGLDEGVAVTTAELEALIAALHKTVQRQLPITLVGAGLPQLPRLAGEAKSYAERLFKFPQIGELGRAEAARALVEPAGLEGVGFDDDAVKVLRRAYDF